MYGQNKKWGTISGRATKLMGNKRMPVLKLYGTAPKFKATVANNHPEDVCFIKRFQTEEL